MEAGIARFADEAETGGISGARPVRLRARRRLRALSEADVLAALESLCAGLRSFAELESAAGIGRPAARDRATAAAGRHANDRGDRAGFAHAAFRTPDQNPLRGWQTALGGVTASGFFRIAPIASHRARSRAAGVASARAESAARADDYRSRRVFGSAFIRRSGASFRAAIRATVGRKIRI